MNTLLLVFGYAFLLGLAVFVALIVRAPAGHEDTAGFHEGEER